MATKTQPGQGAADYTGAERRRSQRVMIRVGVTLHLNVVGHEVVVAAHTLSVNDHGAMVVSPRKIDADTKLEMQHNHTRQRVPCRVTRAPRETPEGYLIPIEFAQSVPSFWQIYFPPTGWKPLED